MTPIGQRIRQIRGKMSVRDFATKIEKSPGYVSQIEARDEIPSADLLCAIAEKFRVDAAELLELAKRSQLERIERDLEQKYQSALALHRKEKRGAK